MKFAVRALVMGLSANAVRIAHKAESKQYYDYGYDGAYAAQVAADVAAADYHGYYNDPVVDYPAYDVPLYSTVYDPVVADVYDPVAYEPLTTYSAGPLYTAGVYDAPLYTAGVYDAPLYTAGYDYAAGYDYTPYADEWVAPGCTECADEVVESCAEIH